MFQCDGGGCSGIDDGVAINFPNLRIAVGATEIIKGKIPTAKQSAGKYSLWADLTALDSKGYLVGIDSYTSDSTYITLKTLKAPKSVKAIGKRRSVKITYKKAAGATKYYIYRSRNKYSGYKRIGLTKNTTFTSKKLKKGKRYYYKIKSVRLVNNKVMSKYSAIVSAKAK